MNMRVIALGPVLILVASAVAACSGGSGGGGANVAPAAVATMTTLSGDTGTLTLTIPRGAASAKRETRYVSANSASLRTTVTSVNGQPPTATQVPQNPSTVPLSAAPNGNCTIGPAGETCTVAIATPTGAVAYQFDLLDANSNVLATNTATQQIGAGSSVNMQVQLKGVVASVAVTAPHLHPGTSFSGPITVQAFDASGALIVGAAPFAVSFTLTDTDATAHTSLTDNATTGATITDGSPNDVVILNYDGANIPSFTITAIIKGQTSTVGTVQVGP